MIYSVWLSQCALSHAKAVELINVFGSAKAVYDARADELSKVCEAHHVKALSNKSLTAANKIVGDCNKCAANILTITDQNYPYKLKMIPDPPIVLYVRGTLPAFDSKLAIAVVGQREATPYGATVARQIAFDLSQSGTIVVSGMAKGIDSAANEGASDGQTPTVAVFGTAIDKCYPAENIRLMRKILQRGACISEYPPNAKGNPAFFPARNRIISGLCAGTLVVEAKQKSGSLITASYALDQGRDVYAVPGGINQASSIGTNELIKNGAKLVTCADDILIEYGGLYKIKAEQSIDMLAQKINLANIYKTKNSENTAAKKQEDDSAAVKQGKAQEKEQDQDPIIALLAKSQEPMHVDTIAEKTGISLNVLMPKLMVLELTGRVQQLAGKLFKYIK